MKIVILNIFKNWNVQPEVVIMQLKSLLEHLEKRYFDDFLNRVE